MGASTPEQHGASAMPNSNEEPLLARDVEHGTGLEGRDKHRKSVAEEQATQMMSELTKTQWMIYLSNPKNLFFLILALTSGFIILNFCFFETLWEPLHYSYLTLITVMAILGLVAGTVNTFYLGQMQDQIDRFRALNQRLGANCDRMEGDLHELK